MYSKLFTFLGFSFLLAACSPLPRQAEALARPQACCISISEFRFAEVQRAKPLEALITTESHSFAFAEGKSYFAAFLLPTNLEARRALLKVHRTGALVSDSQLFCPVVTFLDRELKPLSQTGDLSLSYQPPGWIESGFWYVIFNLPTDATHAVVHTPAAAIGRANTLSGSSPGYSYYTGKSYVYVPGGPSTQSVPCGHTGRVELEVR